MEAVLGFLESIQDTWNILAQDLNDVMATTVQRSYFRFQPTDDSTLHIFVDASQKLYGAVAYLVNNTESTLVMSKNRVAPLKAITLPRLELMAAVVGSRLSVHLQSSLKPKEIVFWSDNQIVLHWLKGNKLSQRFVKNRVNEIQTLTGSSKWNYCPTDQNPADLLTRGITPKQDCNSDLWWKGPSWLPYKNTWPKWDMSNTTALLTATDELQTPEPVIVGAKNQSGIQNIILLDHYSQYKKLLRVTAYVMRFIDLCKKHHIDRKQRTLTVAEIQKAECSWLKYCQQTMFHKEIDNLRSTNPKRQQLVRQLKLFLDTDGFLRCGGRIHNAPLSDKTKFPLLLPSKHHLTRLIIQDAHQQALHSGVSYVVTLLRQTYWIPTIRQCVKSVIRKCVTCRKVSGRPYSAPEAPPLVKYRDSGSQPFSVTGVDFTGALYVKSNSRGKETKSYVCLFTCASTRAVHLELVPDLASETFIQAFRRFVNRKSLPHTMVSDNATTFIGASTEIKRLSQSDSVHEELASKGTRWDFIPKRAPWFGGFWERLIGLTKLTLKRVLGRSYVTFEMLRTIVTEVEAILNDRPLTYIDAEYESLQPLTPAHLLYGRQVRTLPYNGVFKLDEIHVPTINEREVRKRAKQQQTIINHFRERWTKEYLTVLRERHQATGRNKQAITVGDVVQVHADTEPRVKWNLAVVEEVVKGNDGMIRSATIRTANGVTNRPITKLYPLEVNSDEHFDL